MADTAPAARVLVAGIGNIFCADDGFGVEVIRHLAAMQVPDDVRVADFGIRGMHLAYDMLEGDYERVILVDTLPQNVEPGTITVLEVNAEGMREPGATAWDAHGMHPAAVLELLERLGGRPPEVLVVGCQPARLDDHMGLSPAVAAAVGHAAEMVVRLVSPMEKEKAGVPRDSGSDRRTQH